MYTLTMERVELTRIDGDDREKVVEMWGENFDTLEEALDAARTGRYTDSGHVIELPDWPAALSSTRYGCGMVEYARCEVCEVDDDGEWIATLYRADNVPRAYELAWERASANWQVTNAYKMHTRNFAVDGMLHVLEDNGDLWQAWVERHRTDMQDVIDTCDERTAEHVGWNIVADAPMIGETAFGEGVYDQLLDDWSVAGLVAAMAAAIPYGDSEGRYRPLAELIVQYWWDEGTNPHECVHTCSGCAHCEYSGGSAYCARELADGEEPHSRDRVEQYWSACSHYARVFQWVNRWYADSYWNGSKFESTLAFERGK